MRVRSLLAPVLAAATVVLTATGASADATISSSGPLIEITTTDDLNCSVLQKNDNFPSWFMGTACGTFLAVGDSLYGPESVPGAGNTGVRTPWEPVSQTSGGTGTEADPFLITTTVSGGPVVVVQRDIYVEGQNTYSTEVDVTLAAGAPTTEAILYRAGDCQVDNSNFAFGNLDPDMGTVSCQSADTSSGEPVRGDRFVLLSPVTEGSTAQEGQYTDIWQVLGDRVLFNDLCVCDPPPDLECGRCSYDNGIGLSWPLVLAPGTTVTTISNQTFTPLDLLPLSTLKTVDQPEALPGETVTYTMSLTNPNDTDVTTESFTDLLPAGFSYVPGSTTGDTTLDPTETVEEGRTRLTWVVQETLGQDQSATISFDIVVADRGGVYDNEASGTSDKGDGEEDVTPFMGATVTVSDGPVPVVPEVPVAVLLPLGAMGLLALAVRRRAAA